MYLTFIILKLRTYYWRNCLWNFLDIISNGCYNTSCIKIRKLFTFYRCSNDRFILSHPNLLFTINLLWLFADRTYVNRLVKMPRVRTQSNYGQVCSDFWKDLIVSKHATGFSFRENMICLPRDTIIHYWRRRLEEGRRHCRKIYWKVSENY